MFVLSAVLLICFEREIWQAEVELDGMTAYGVKTGKVATAAGDPTYEVFSLATMKSATGSAAQFHPATEVEVVWQKPPKADRVLFVAHGCSHGAIDFWPQSDACPKCIGLPEEQTIVKAALGRRYMVVAISSMDRANSRCWRINFPTDPSADDDTFRVTKVMQTLMQREGLSSAPVYALGASSGGAFVPVLAHQLQLTGVVMQIMAQQPAVFSLPQSHSFPPVVFVHMERDRRTTYGVEIDREAMKKVGAPSAAVVIKPAAIHEHFFSDRIEGVTPAVSHTHSASFSLMPVCSFSCDRVSLIGVGKGATSPGGCTTA
jgi:hypothetical protein